MLNFSQIYVLTAADFTLNRGGMGDRDHETILISRKLPHPPRSNPVLYGTLRALPARGLVLTLLKNSNVTFNL